MDRKAGLKIASVWMMRIGIFLFAIALLKNWLSPNTKTNTIESCIIECNAASELTTQAGQLCLSEPKQGDALCFRLDDIIMVKTYNKRSVVYDYRGRGQYVKENLTAIERAIQQTNSGYFYLCRANRQEIVNLRYTRRFNTCNRQLHLEEDFESTVARDKVKKVERLIHRSCSVIGR